MKIKHYLIAVILCASAAVSAQSVWNAEHLAEVRKHLQKPYYATAYEALKAQADSMLDAKPLSVMQKEKLPASGDRHDYLSQARYFWPDLAKPDGLPYINRDGLSNPELEKLDRNRLGQTAERVTTLSLAWYFSGEEKYAQKAVELIRVWFLDEETKMNPHLRYAQVVPGQNNNEGRSYGLIDTYSFVEMLDAVALLEQSASFTSHDSKQLKAWFGKLLDWMLTSPQGKEEAACENNHGTAYDAQIVAFALYAGRSKVAREVLHALPAKRIFRQIESDGRQLHELTRTLAFHYSQYNLTHFIDLLLMADKAGVDLKHAVSADGRSVYKGMDFLAQYAGKDVSAWPYKQIHGWDTSLQLLYKDLYRVGTYIDASRTDYLQLYRVHRVLNLTDRFHLLYAKPTEIDQAFAFACSQLELAMQCVEMAKREERNAIQRKVSPRSIDKYGNLDLVHPHDWCSGFFPGTLWQVYEYTHNDYWRRKAISYTWPIEEAKWHKGTHDLGFMMYDSFGKAYALTGERSYLDVVVQSARTLITRYSPKVQSIRSWDHNRDKWKFPVIIDNMMNLEMLFRATQLTGDSVFWNVAVNHANTTLKNHFRTDHSSFHVVDYDPETGDVRLKCTHQGYADDSFWSRGQGWGLYAFAMCYRFTHDAAYLRQSESIADFFLSLPNLPADGVPYWDMKMPEVNGCTPEQANASVPRDASAAALIASGLYELSGYVTFEKAQSYRAFADRILDSLHRHYQAEPGTHFGFLLLHSTGHYPAGSEIDVPLCYADYYYLEALLRRQQFSGVQQVLSE